MLRRPPAFEACPAKVDTGFAKKDMRKQSEELDQDGSSSPS
jgi:hypothetical protein